MKLKERDYWLGFNVFPGIGPKRFSHLLKVFGSAKKTWQAKKDKLLQTQVPKKILQDFFQFRQTWDFFSYLLRLEKELIKFFIIEDKEYPENLKKIDFAPPLIYVKGKILPQDSSSIAVIGARKITSYGREVTERLVQDLCNAGLTIVSGLARGVDSVAHRVALGNQSRTLAVVGSGLDNIYPVEHRALAQKIVSQNLGAIISELALGLPPLKGHFPSRNRIISGLSLGVLVTEGATVSGTKITADCCLLQKRKLFAVPGPITSALSEGPADLIKKGAKLVTQAGDILKEIPARGWLNLDRQIIQKSNRKNPAMQFKNDQEKEIFQILAQGGRHIDEMVRLAHFDSGKTLSLLTEMELEGKVKNIGGGHYILA